MSGIADAIAAAEPGAPARLGGLVERLDRSRRLRGARLGGRAIGPAGLASVEVRGVTYDSRRVRAGNVFVAIPGARADGHDFVGRAAEAGASAALVERPLPEVGLPQVVVDDARAGLATAAAWWYGDPSHALEVVGITGTDGKTTTSFLALGALEAIGRSCGLVGTVETKIGEVREPNEEHATTPEAPELQAALQAMRAGGNDTAIIETTSHGLALRRVDEVAYDAAILTNLTHEHLELHGTWEAYRDAKLSLFERLPRGGLAVVNADDDSAGLFAGVAQEAGGRVLTYGTDERADVRATRVEDDGRRLRIGYAAPSGEGALTLRIAGRFNAHNALAVVALGEGWGLDAGAVCRGLEAVEGVPGRMERVEAGQPFGVIIDFAHSPASLEKVLELLAPLAAARGGELIAVFGSAGERDVGKRSMMGRVAGRLCRLVVATDEDPRGEDSMTILDEIARGAEAAGKVRDRDVLLVPDRRAAIGAAFERARPGDFVLLAGKGHERSIIGRHGPTPWDERAAALDALAELGYVAAR